MAQLWQGLPIGARSDVENVKIESLQAFYQKYYQPDNSTLVVAGKFDEMKMLELIQQKFGVDTEADPRDTERLDDRADAGRRTSGQFRRVGDTQLVMSGYHVPPVSHPTFRQSHL